MFYGENISVLLPGGPGFLHNTGKAENYCLKFTNGTHILGESGEEICQSGDGIEVDIESPYKWMLNWVEIYEPFVGPFEATLKYVLPLEDPMYKPPLDFVKPKFYLPAQAHPVFELNMYKGNLKSKEIKFGFMMILKVLREELPIVSIIPIHMIIILSSAILIGLKVILWNLAFGRPVQTRTSFMLPLIGE